MSNQECILTNAVVVTPNESLQGTVVTRGGVIEDVQPGRSTLPNAQDLGGDYLLPGLVELHTDNVEKQLVPRPGFVWPAPQAAVLAHDAQIVHAGITTVLDSVCVGEYRRSDLRRELLSKTVESLRALQPTGFLRAEHLLHIRCELSDDAVVDVCEPLVDEPLVKLVSLMDHTPGQRQWRDLEKMKTLYTERMDDSAFDHLTSEWMSQDASQRETTREAIIALWRHRDLPLATHDDTTREHVEQAVEQGIKISEFPTTEEAARAARQHGLGVIMGAPNLIRGESHSGNVSAAHLAELGLVDSFSSDYMPASLLHAMFVLHSQLGYSIHEASARVAKNPAQMVGLNDRGEIAPSKRADLVRVRQAASAHMVVALWREGERMI